MENDQPMDVDEEQELNLLQMNHDFPPPAEIHQAIAEAQPEVNVAQQEMIGDAAPDLVDEEDEEDSFDIDDEEEELNLEDLEVEEEQDISIEESEDLSIPPQVNRYPTQRMRGLIVQGVNILPVQGVNAQAAPGVNAQVAQGGYAEEAEDSNEDVALDSDGEAALESDGEAAVESDGEAAVESDGEAALESNSEPILESSNEIIPIEEQFEFELADNELVVVAPIEIAPIEIGPMEIRPPGRALPQIAPAGMALPQIVPAGMALPQIEPAGMALPQIAPAGMALPQIAAGGRALPQIAPAGMALPQIVPAGRALPQIAPAGMAFPQIAPAGMALPQIALAEIGPVEIGPVEIGPVEIGPAEIGPAEIRPVRPPMSAKDVLPFFDIKNCYLCNGYYGPCFLDPVCATCHAFIFPNLAPDIQVGSSSEHISDDSDSGNDEPVDNAFAITGSGSGDHLPQPNFPPITPPTLQCELNRLSVMQHEVEINIESLPPEVLIHMFSYLDEISLWCVGQVCRRWREIMLVYIPANTWKKFVLKRWPLFIIPNINEIKRDNTFWYQVYTKLMKSCSCLKCIRQMAAQENPIEPESSWREHRLRTELKLIRTDPMDDIQARPLDPWCYHWEATIQGPVGSPYEGGLFFLYIQIPYTYPMSPPVVRFLTKIFHPNVSRHGDVGIDSIHHNWSLALTINKVLISIQSLLTDPYCEICMEPAVGRLYVENRPAFEEVARQWTWKYAMIDLTSLQE